ncbi:MAG TPA: Gfo/Idh/MocA family oxidoreductase [Abditibacteriaceae bacterium]|nr:Gfo/Idh/MocA family oxidoreductase [Abditibacteriaceae bacterium]
MEKVRCAVIGAGWWATTAHIPALKSHPAAELVAVQTSEQETADRIAADFDAPYATTVVEDVLALDELDAVIVSSIPKLHYEQAKAALERGMHVLIEKPMTFTVREARELVEIAERNHLVFLISAPWHYTPHGIEARRLIQAGALGQLKMISILMTNFTQGLYQGLPWEKVFGKNPTLQNSATPYLRPGQYSYSDPLLAGGGQIYCQVSHAAAYVGFLTNTQPREVFARFDNAGTAVDVYDALNIKLSDGTLVSLASTGATMLSDRHYEVRIYGTRGMILLELWKGTMEFHDIDCNVQRYSDLPEAEIYPMFAPAGNFVDAVLGQAPNGSPATLGLYAMKIIEAARASAGENRNVVIAD